MISPNLKSGSHLLSAVILFLLLPSTSKPARADEWTKLVDCVFINNGINDGDSFLIKNRGTTYVFRLYWVDSPEDVIDYPERVREQADYFGITAEEVMQIGREAKLFSQDFLSNDKLTIYTQWENGQGNIQRYYAIAYSSKGNLIEALVKNGLARIYGYSKGWPNEPNIDSFRRHLVKLENEAKRNGLGAWRKNIEVWSGLDYRKKLAALPDLTERLNINTATREELLLLPGIGQAYSQRIMEARPFQEVEELLEIKGIGPKTFERIKNKITVSDK